MPITRQSKKLIDWPTGEAMPQAIAQIVLDRIKANAARHIGSFGKKYKPNANGNPDWKESGHMLGDAKAYKGGKIQFFAWYTSMVNKARPFADGFTKREIKEMAALAKPHITAAIRQKKGK